MKKLHFENLSKSYGKNLALDGFTLTLEPGIYALLGPNGSGKSTLMNIITDNLKADSGAILYEEEGKKPENVLSMGARFRSMAGYMPQYPGMYANFTVRGFLWYMAALKNAASEEKGRVRRKRIAEEIETLLSQVELSGAANRPIRTLSGGMKQRLGLAQALLGDPSIIILDEPTAGLDPKQRIAIRNLISQVALNKIVLIATHVVSDVEFIARKVIFLKKGRIVDVGSPWQLAEQASNRVWQMTVEESTLPELQRKYRITNLSRSEIPSKITLRILSDTPPGDTALPAKPTLEDAYLCVFQEETGAV